MDICCTSNIIPVVVVFLSSIVAGENYVFEEFRTSCRDTTPQCLKDNIQKILPEFVRGIPSLGISTLDPFQVDKINLAMPGGLSIEFKEGQSKGLRRCVVDSASFDGDKYRVIVYCNITIKGKYRSYGKLFMFPINGEGNATIICNNIKIYCTLKLGTRTENSKEYFEIKEYDIKHSYEGQVIYKITNLFKGSPEISNMVLEFMNRNWRLVAEEFGDPIVNFGIESVLVNIKKLINTVPINGIIKKV